MGTVVVLTLCWMPGIHGYEGGSREQGAGEERVREEEEVRDREQGHRASHEGTMKRRVFTALFSLKTMRGGIEVE